MDMRRRVTAVSTAAVVIALVVGAAFAADMSMAAETQLKGAISEAKAAQAAGTLKDAREHLQSVINCIEGPKGAMFRKMAGAMMSPCEGKGNGLLADAKASGGRWGGALPWIELANTNAAAGVKAMSLAKARASGAAAQFLLERADKAMMMGK
jgi:hypothetical protein